MKIMSGRRGLFACEVMVVLLVGAGEDEGMQIKKIIKLTNVQLVDKECLSTKACIIKEKLVMKFIDSVI